MLSVARALSSLECPELLFGLQTLIASSLFDDSKFDFDLLLSAMANRTASRFELNTHSFGEVHCCIYMVSLLFVYQYQVRWSHRISLSDCVTSVDSSGASKASPHTRCSRRTPCHLRTNRGLRERAGIDTRASIWTLRHEHPVIIQLGGWRYYY